MSEEIALARGDIAQWRRRAEQAEALALTLQRQRDAAEADAAALRHALNVIIAGIKDHARRDLGDYLLIAPTAAVFARATLKVRPSGTQLVAELEAARAYLDYVLETYPPTSITEAALRRAYDATVKARQG